MATYLSLEEAAQKLGVTTDRLVELRNEGQIRGFRDGTSWKFPDTEIDRLADELGDDLGGSGLLVNEQEVGSPLTQSSGTNIIGGDEGGKDGSGSDLELGTETLQPGSGGSDVNLVPAEGEGSDVAVVASDSDLLLEGGSDELLEIDSGELQIDDPAIMHDSAQLDLAIEPNAGSTGPVTDKELEAISESGGDVLSESPVSGAGDSGSMLELGGESDELLAPASDLSFAGGPEEEDSGEELLGAEDSAMDVLGGDTNLRDSGSHLSSAGVSSLELMDELDSPSTGGSSLVGRSSLGQDVLSELDILGGDKKEGSALSGLAAGDSGDLLSASSGLGSSIGADALGDDSLSGIDDALADDDDLVIADDDDDLVLSSHGSDISVAGDSGINLMSPSDSGLSLESEPLDLAGSSISALDLGAEIAEGSGSGSGGSGSGREEGSGSLVDFQADEEFQLSPSGVGLDADFDSGSQEIEVEDSEAMAEPVDFGADPMGDDALGGDVFGGAVEADDAAADALGLDDEDSVVVDDTVTARVPAAAGMAAYEIPFTLLQVVTLMMIIGVMSLGGMLMTDLVRNMWTYSEPAAPVSSLTDSLISLMGWGQ